MQGAMANYNTLRAQHVWIPFSDAEVTHFPKDVHPFARLK